MEKITLSFTNGRPVNKASINYNPKYGDWFFYDKKLGGYIMIRRGFGLSTGKTQETERFMKDQYEAGCEFYVCTDRNMWGELPDIQLDVLNVELPPKQMSGRKSTPATRKIYRKAPTQKPTRR